MKKLTITGKELRAIGFPEGPVISLTMQVAQKAYKHESKTEVIDMLTSLLANPDAYATHDVLAGIALKLMPAPAMDECMVSMNTSAVPLQVYGQGYIEEGALHQMYLAAKLPIAVAGALMPDAHSGYGLPIGGVLATENAVIPYGVGVDIGCRMCLSLFDINPKELANREPYFVRELNEATLFGSGAQFQQAASHEIMEHPLFKELAILKTLHERAWKQLGSSGSGNHFAEFGTVEITEPNAIPGVPEGIYTGLLTHSGSRALGANIANHYTKIAISKRKLPAEAKNLAWLGLDEEAGIEYWNAMNLAGEYASACHHVIHEKIAIQLGRKPMAMVENHHNFAWKEQWNGRDVIVHRKGATPAGEGVLGIIPGSMTAPGFIVQGKGEVASINSASHGAGRKMSRTKAMASVTEKQFREALQKSGVKLIGGGLDESPFAYKDIHEVMQSQQTLVGTVGKFIPRIVKMDGAVHKSRKRPSNTIITGE